MFRINQYAGDKRFGFVHCVYKRQMIFFNIFISTKN